MSKTICNPYAALVALRTGSSFESIQSRLSVSDSLTWVVAIGGAMAVIEDKSSRLFQDIEKLDAWIESQSLSAVGGPLCNEH